ncbi:MAG: hypothetical protein ABFS45_19950 [Pseudomonadota bacterium]
MNNDVGVEHWDKENKGELTEQSAMCLENSFVMGKDILHKKRGVTNAPFSMFPNSS